MHLATLLFALLASAAAVSAQNLTGLPPCGVACRDANLCNTLCDPADTPCLCRDQTFFLDVYSCEAATCPGNDAAASVAWARHACGFSKGRRTRSYWGV